MMTTTIIIMMMKLIPNLSPPKRESCKEGKVEEYPGEEEEKFPRRVLLRD